MTIYRYECSLTHKSIIQKLVGKNYITNKDFQIVVNCLLNGANKKTPSSLLESEIQNAVPPRPSERYTQNKMQTPPQRPHRHQEDHK